MITVFFGITTFGSAGQLGGLLKKTKDKVTAPTQTNKAETVENTRAVAEADKTGSMPANEKTETTFYLYDQQYGYRSGGSNYTVANLKAQNIRFTPYSYVRKSEEKGSFHFAKDYPEFTAITEPVNNDLSITFSNKTFTGGGEIITNSFTSANGIYAKFTATKGTLKEALKIADNDDGIILQFVLYDDADETINAFTTIEKFQLTAAQANGKSITFDIIPSVPNFSQGKQSDFWVGTFAYNHKEYIFKRNGNYKVGLFLKNEKVDHWGKPIYGDDIVFANFFDYNFSANDAPGIVKEASEVNDIKQKSVKNVITPLPKQWTEKSSPLVMGVTQAQLIAIYQNSFSDKMDAHAVVKFHASSSSGGWTTVNNDFGIPIYRYSNQWYTVFIKYANGKTCFYQGFGLRQAYNGGGTYGQTIIDKNEYHMADCGLMK